MVERGLGILCESPRMKLSQSSTWGSVVYFLFSAIYEIQHQFWWEGEVMNLSKLLQNIYFHKSSSSLKLMLNIIHSLIKWSLFRFPWIRNKLLILKWKIATVSALYKIPRPLSTINLLCYHEKQYLLLKY